MFLEVETPAIKYKLQSDAFLALESPKALLICSKKTQKDNFF